MKFRVVTLAVDFVFSHAIGEIDEQLQQEGRVVLRVVGGSLVDSALLPLLLPLLLLLTTHLLTRRAHKTRWMPSGVVAKLRRDDAHRTGGEDAGTLTAILQQTHTQWRYVFWSPLSAGNGDCRHTLALPVVSRSSRLVGRKVALSRLTVCTGSDGLT